MTSKATDVQWKDWFDLQSAAAQAWFKGGLETAIAMLDEFVNSEPPRVVKRQALGFRGSLHEENGEFQAAKSDFLAARELSEQPDFERYTLEESIAALCERLGSEEDIEFWILQALATAAADPRVSGGGALLRLLKHRGSLGFTDEEMRLVEKVVYQGWILLRVEGEPDLKHLVRTAKRLVRAHRGPFSADRPPTPAEPGAG
jgi:hypothetical protein